MCISVYFAIYYVHIGIYLDILSRDLIFFVQHAHIENIKTVANLSNNKDVFMCILRFHARAGYLQTYETMLGQLKSHPDSDQVPQDHSQTAISMSPANRESAILHLSPC